MARYIARRLVLLVIVLVGMSAITFSLTHLVPGNPARLLAGPHASQSEVDSLAHQFGLDRPVPERTVLSRHVLKNALLPTVTVIGLQVGYLLSGNILAEAVFSWPGIGLYAVNAIGNLDYAAIMGVTLIISFVYVLVNLLVDLLYAVIDPRISYA